MNKKLFVGLDVHKDTIAVAVAEDGRGGEIRFHGIIVNSADAVLRLTKTLTKNRHAPSFCYEAGPCGYGLHRHLTKFGFECAVVAPTMIPRKVGDRVKTDRRDAEMLARLWRAGELTPIWTHGVSAAAALQGQTVSFILAAQINHMEKIHDLLCRPIAQCEKPESRNTA